MAISRRTLIQAAAAGTAFPKLAGAADTYADAQAAERWMNTWMMAPGSVTSALHLGRFADPMYFLRKEIKWSPNSGQERLPSVTVPVGFVTDFASIPRVFWSALRPDGDYTYAAIIHDYLYWTQGIERSDADLVFKYAMEDFKIGSVVVGTIYAGVRVGGGSAWDENAAKKASGEKRILKTFPEDPRITWPAWKSGAGAMQS